MGKQGRDHGVKSGGSVLKRLRETLTQTGVATSFNKISKHASHSKRQTELTKRQQARQTLHQLAAARKAANPFETLVSRSKQTVLGRVVKGTQGRPGQARALGEQKRQETLLAEYQSRNSNNVFVDRRIGENNPTLSVDDRMQERLRLLQKRRKTDLANRFNLNVDDDAEGGLLGGDTLQLTHRGQALGEGKTLTDVSGFDRPNDFDDDAAQADLNASLNFGGFEPVKGDNADGHKSRNEVMKELIAKSKMHKAERQRLREKEAELLEEVDDVFHETRALLREQQNRDHAFLAQFPDAAATADPLAQQEADANAAYDDLIVSLQSEKRARPTDRTKTIEERLIEENARLAKLEAERQMRMLKGDADLEDPESLLADPTALPANGADGGDALEEANAMFARRTRERADFKAGRKRKHDAAADAADAAEPMALTYGKDGKLVNTEIFMRPPLRSNQDSDDSDEDDSDEDDSDEEASDEEASDEEDSDDNSDDDNEATADVAENPAADDLPEELQPTGVDSEASSIASDLRSDADSESDADDNASIDSATLVEMVGEAEAQRIKAKLAAASTAASADAEPHEAAAPIPPAARTPAKGGDDLDDDYVASDVESTSEVSETGQDELAVAAARLSKTASQIPFTFDFPATADALQDLHDSFKGPLVFTTVLHRIRVQYHPSLGEHAGKHKLLLKLLLTKLMPAVTATWPCEMERLQEWLPHLVQLGAVYPVLTSKWARGMVVAFREKLDELGARARTDAGLADGKDAWALFNLTEAVTFRLFSHLFSTSDKTHGVITPATVLLTSLLASDNRCRTEDGKASASHGSLAVAPVTSYAAVMKGLYVCDLLTEWHAESRRWLPEVVGFLDRTLRALAGMDTTPNNAAAADAADAAVPTKLQPIGSWATASLGDLDLGALLVKLPRVKKSKAMTQATLAHVEQVNQQRAHVLMLETDMGKRSLLTTALALLERSLDLWGGRVPCADLVFAPLVPVLTRIQKRAAKAAHAAAKAAAATAATAATAPEAPADAHALATSAAALAGRIATLPTARERLQLLRRKPVAIASWLPAFHEHYSLDKHYDQNRERAQAQKLQRELKQEKRGAVRELRKDGQFLARVKLQEEKAAGVEYKKKMDKIVGQLAAQEGAMRGFERANASRKKKKRML
ncbi:hypothetical protein CXG81DRAFT_16347 [Caulochytrium protostelioides]|uniref:Nop14-like protein n=1 Tax=Caulochytrium protostelioides TaxID=1555241 RepID=A0A4V1IVI8_9FUNG|nr:hypothetical protein CXG81DRAFT_16347 [Caulochytrium protostelioides]|eukprot:RKP04209.1 hypothetical protein CXG81DRAFT_16347 [Caulochytrium protostelioides]